MNVERAEGSPPPELTLKDHLSRLTYRRACTLLGEGAAALIRQGGMCEIDLDEQVHLDNHLLRVTLPDAVALTTLTADVPQRLQWDCTACDTACEHVGAALSLVLEEKTPLGLAAPPPERVPIESLSEEDLVGHALEERRERANTERMRVKSTGPDVLWTDYLVTNAMSGKTYRVALRGWECGQSYCSCPDFRKNTLGTCKHIMNVQRKVKSRFPAPIRNRPYEQKDFAVHLRYGKELELRLLAPPRLAGPVASIVRPIRGRPIGDVRDLLRRIRKLEAQSHAVTIYPDAEQYIHHRLFQDRMESTVAEIRRDPAAHPLRKTLLKAELLPYQLDGVAFAAGAGRAILADDMGLGKTIQAIGVAELLAREANLSRVLIICPASLKSQWRNEIHRFSDRDCQIVLGPAAQRPRQYDNGCFFTICNYEQVLRDIVTIETIPWDLIVLDEGQRIKNWEAKTSRVVKGLRSPFALVLSGTPLENRLDDLFSVTEFIDDRRLGAAFRFYNRHRVVDERGRVLGYKNLADVRRRLAPILLRRTRGSVMKELPPRTTEILRITPTAEQADIHDGQKRIICSIVNKPYINEIDLLRLQKALLICRMAADSTFLVDKQEPAYSSKLEELDNLLDSLAGEADRKTLLFSEWTTMLNLVQPLLEKRDLAYVRLDGSVPQKKRQQLVRTFQNDRDCRLFITTNAGATGLNLQAANTVVNVDLPWNPAVLEQRIARAHRMGQKNPVQVFVLVTEGTIEESLLATLSAKHELAMAALDVESDVDAVDLTSGIDELKRRLEVLLGRAPEAPVDESERARLAAEAARLARRQNVAAAGGQLLGAAFQFLGQMLPAQEETDFSQRAADMMKQRLAECMETGEDGQLKLTVTFPDSSALETLAGSLARVLGPGLAAGSAVH